MSSNVLKTSASYISQAFCCETVILLPDEGKQIEIQEKYGTTEFSNKDYAIAHWVYKNRKPARKYTETLTVSDWKYFPLQVNEHVFGVLGISVTKPLTPEQDLLLDSFASIIALYLKRM